MTCGARARILPDALRHNLERVRELAPGCRVMAAIKGNAYGHGLLTAARCFASADSVAVARLSEAAALRDAGVRQAIVLLPGFMCANELREAARLQCELVVHNNVQLALLERLPAGQLIVWLKVDTGMHRLGFPPATVAAAIARLREINSVVDVRLLSHLACADEKDGVATDRQVNEFRALTAGFTGDISIANSAAVLSGEVSLHDPQYWGNHGATWVRPGIALYGISPFPERCGSEFGLQPAMQFETRLLDVKPVAKGASVGYGARWQAPADGWLGIIAAGYGDGYSRFLPSGTPVLVNGRRMPLAGTVSMDLAAIDLGPEPAGKIGDSVVLWGPQLPVEQIAACAGTIAYQLVTGVMHREEPAIGQADG